MAPNYLPKVKEQYEALPYPPRNPQDELKRLVKTDAENLVAINHNCFAGKQTFNNDFRVLVAGGGTGDSTIYLAEQLRETNAEVVYLDLSSASREIAEQRAQIRNLTNIKFITGSILDLASYDLGRFDYISSTGVLHHLDSPEQGLKELVDALKPQGAVYLMLYGKYGRQPIYETQALLKELIDTSLPPSEQARLARQVLAGLPPHHRFKQVEGQWLREISESGYGDTGLFDLLLHTQDVAYTVQDIMNLTQSVGLRFIDFVGRGKPLYMLENATQSPELLSMLDKKSHIDKMAITEQIRQDITNHSFVLSPNSNAQAKLSDHSLALICVRELSQYTEAIHDAIVPGQYLDIKLNLEFEGQALQHTYAINGSDVNKLLFKYLDGTTTLTEFYQIANAQFPTISEQELSKEVQAIFELFHPHGWIFLTNPDIHKG